MSLHVWPWNCGSGLHYLLWWIGCLALIASAAETSDSALSVPAAKGKDTHESASSNPLLGIESSYHWSNKVENTTLFNQTTFNTLEETQTYLSQKWERPTNLPYRDHHSDILSTVVNARSKTATTSSASEDDSISGGVHARWTTTDSSLTNNHSQPLASVMPFDSIDERANESDASNKSKSTFSAETVDNIPTLVYEGYDESNLTRYKQPPSDSNGTAFDSDMPTNHSGSEDDFILNATKTTLPNQKLHEIMDNISANTSGPAVASITTQMANKTKTTKNVAGSNIKTTASKSSNKDKVKQWISFINSAKTYFSKQKLHENVDNITVNTTVDATTMVDDVNETTEVSARNNSTNENDTDSEDVNTTAPKINYNITLEEWISSILNIGNIPAMRKQIMNRKHPPQKRNFKAKNGVGKTIRISTTKEHQLHHANTDSSKIKNLSFSSSSDVVNSTFQDHIELPFNVTEENSSNATIHLNDTSDNDNNTTNGFSSNITTSVAFGKEGNSTLKRANREKSIAATEQTTSEVTATENGFEAKENVSSPLHSNLSVKLTPANTTIASNDTVPAKRNSTFLADFRISGVLRIVEGVEWIPELTDSKGVEYRRLSHDLRNQLENVFAKTIIGEMLKRIIIKGFSREGSVIVEYSLWLKEYSDTLDRGIMIHLFNSQLKLTNGKLGKYTADLGYTNFEVPAYPTENENSTPSDDPPVPQWAIAVIVIAAACLIFFILFGAVTIYGRSHSSTRCTQSIYDKDGLVDDGRDWEKYLAAAYENLAADSIYDIRDKDEQQRRYSQNCRTMLDEDWPSDYLGAVKSRRPSSQSVYVEHEK